MSRSYKKYPHARDRNSYKKRFRKAFNRHVRRANDDLANGGHYRKNAFGFSLPEYDYYYGYYSYRNVTLSEVRRDHESELKQLANGHTYHNKWTSRPRSTPDPIEQVELEWKKQCYFK